MPLPGFITSIADKAQSAIQASPIGHHIGSGRPASPDAAAQPSANDAAAHGGHRGGALGNLQHQIRAFGQQYSSSTTPAQKIITTQKGIAIDLDSLASDSKAQSKELYTWGQGEGSDLMDVSDRMAYLNFVQGSLASSLAVRIDAARAPLKVYRDAELLLIPRRNTRNGLQNQLDRYEHDNQRGNERKMAELREQLRLAESEDTPAEKELELLKRKALRESEQLKWEAIREYAEKLLLLSQAAPPILAALPVLPPTAQQPYRGGEATGAVRASLQRALDNYKTGHIHLDHSQGADLGRSDTRSFGESHASELSSIHSFDASTSIKPGIPLTPPEKVPSALPSHATPHQPPQPSNSLLSQTSIASNISHASTTPPHQTPLNPSVLNNNPAPIPGQPSVTAVAPAPLATDSKQPPAITPTIAETGTPVSGGGNTGPSSGSLADIRKEHDQSSSYAPPAGPPSGIPVVAPSGATWGSAEEEKKRLREQYSTANTPAQPQPGVTTSQLPSQPHQPEQETAEDEKKRLEREERERALNQPNAPKLPKKEDDLPPYQDM